MGLKPGLKTTEFALAVVAASAAFVIQAVVLPNTWESVLGLVAGLSPVGLYILGRNKAKAIEQLRSGPSEPEGPQ